MTSAETSLPSPSPACAALRKALLHLHRTLVAQERIAYEKLHGRQSAGEFLQVMAYAEEMRWLEPLSRLIVMLDEAMDDAGEAALTPQAVVERARALLRLDRDSTDAFASRYAQQFDTSPDLAHAHAATLAALKG